MGWLIPRLIDFHREHPGIDVRLDTSLELVDLHGGEFDAAIRFTVDPDATGLRTHCLVREDLVMVCAAPLAKSLTAPAQLAAATLLHTQSRPGLWRAWLAAAGVERPDPERGPRFSSDSLALEAAASGLGAALAERTVATGWIDVGRLVVPFEMPFPGRHGYHLVYAEDASRQPRVMAFRDWLLEAISTDGAQDTPMAGGEPHQ
jgi:LysR family transcriptional regulator, glycine cleavage system transcriptional activator